MKEPPKCSNVECDNEGWKGTVETPMCRECDAMAAHGVPMTIKASGPKEDQTMNMEKKVHKCGALTKKGNPCENPVSRAELLCHHHKEKAYVQPSESIQAMIEAFQEDKTKEVDNMRHRLTIPGHPMHYMVMTLDEYENPVVLSRVFTNMEHQPQDYEVPEDAALIPCDIGEDYSMAFMEQFCGDTPYWVEFLPHGSIESVREKFPNAALAWADEETITVITLPEYPYWGGLEELTGLVIKPSMKLAKRLKEVTRVSRYFRHFDDGQVTVHIFDEGTKEHFDGKTFVRRSFLAKLDRGKSKTLRNTAKSGSFRLLGKFGFIKGDFIVANNDSDIEADVVTHRENVKSEIRLVDSGTWASCFLHHDHSMPVTDIQSLSWLGETVFPLDQLEEELRRAGMDVISDLRRGKFPAFMETYTDNDGNFDMDDPGVIADMRAMYNRWTVEGRSLNESAFFMHMIGTGFLNKMRSGLSFPIPWATYGHIVTEEMLIKAGYAEDVEYMEGYMSYHVPTGCICLPGDVFKAIFSNHGGWDGDDAIRVLIRNFMEDGLYAFNLRSPNAYGEYSIIPVDTDSFDLALYNTEGDIPEMGVTVKEFKRVINTIQRVDTKATYEGMPSSTFGLEDTYTYNDAVSVIEIMETSPGVGSWANAQMVYYATTGKYRLKQLAHTEDIVDTLTQSVNPDGFIAIADDITDTWDEIQAIGKVDHYFSHIDRRVPQTVLDNVKPVNGFLTELAVAHKKYLNRFEDVLGRLSNHRRRSIVLSSKLTNLVTDEHMDRAKAAEVWFRGLADDAPKGRQFTFQKVDGTFPGASRLILSYESQKYWRDANRLAVKTILDSGDPTTMVIALYLYTEKLIGYKRTNGIDRILFAPHHPDEASVMDLFLSVLRSNDDFGFNY